MKKTLLIILGVVLLAIMAIVYQGIMIQNQIVFVDEAVKTRWGYVESAYQRRADLIPNLVQTVQASGKFEKSTLEAVIAARASATQVRLTANDLSDAGKFQSFAQAQDSLGTSLSRLLVTIEQYPDLKTTAQFHDLMTELEGTENRINTERNYYNDAVKEYNLYVRTFPASIVAAFLGVHPREPFHVMTPDAEKAPAVQFTP